MSMLELNESVPPHSKWSCGLSKDFVWFDIFGRFFFLRFPWSWDCGWVDNRVLYVANVVPRNGDYRDDFGTMYQSLSFWSGVKTRWW